MLLRSCILLKVLLLVGKCSKMISVYAFRALKSSFLDCEKNIGNLIQNLK